MLNHLKKQNKNNRLYIVHRIDRETSGILLFAKSKEVQLQLQQNWHRQVYEKIYIALVEGCVDKESDTIHSWLVEEPKSKIVYSFDYDNGGLESITHYKVEKRFKQNTLLRVSLEYKVPLSKYRYNFTIFSDTINFHIVAAKHKINVNH